MRTGGFKTGDIFAMPLPDGCYIHGRVILDVRRCVRRRLLPADSPLPGVGEAALVDMYCGVAAGPEFTESAVLTHGAFIQPHCIGKEWPIVGNAPIQPQSIAFPESLVGFMHERGQAAFECGEIRIPLPITHSKYEEIAVRKTCHSAFLWPYTCLRQLGRGNEVPADYAMATLSTSDLRMSGHRAFVYGFLPIKMSDTYWEQQRKLGMDVSRLFEE